MEKRTELLLSKIERIRDNLIKKLNSHENHACPLFYECVSQTTELDLAIKEFYTFSEKYPV